MSTSRSVRNKYGTGRRMFNIMVTFLLSGLWHGANWTFVVWGGLNGLLISLGAMTKKTRDAIARSVGLGQTSLARRVMQIAITFSLFVFGLIFFRSTSLGEAWYIITHLFHDIGAWGDKHYWREAFSYRSIGLDDAELRIAFFSIVALEAVQAVQNRGRIRTMLAKRHWALRWSLYLLIVWAILSYGMYVETQPFIYFQF